MISSKPRQLIAFFSLNLFVTLIVVTILSIPFFAQVNQRFVDQLHGSISARNEIVIVSIDDSSLQEIGAWPWDRSVFADVIQKISEGGAKVIGVDVLFLEPRTGDDQLSNILNFSETPVVLASKLDGEQTYIPLYIESHKQETNFKLADGSPSYKNIHSGFINFDPDTDGKIRRTFFPGEELTNFQTSFAFSTLDHYLPENHVMDTLSQQYPSQPFTNRNIQFNYTHDDFDQVSLADIYKNRTDSTKFKDKIVLIGTTAQDIKSNLSDNLTDIFGNSTPGIIIHANVMNSFLHDRFQHDFPILYSLGIATLLTILLSFVFRIVRSNTLDIIICVVSLLAVNIAGLFIFDFGYNWPFLTFTMVVLFAYVSALAQKYITESRQKKFIQQAFSQYMNPSLLNQLLAEPDHLKLGGEKKEMTVMFSDVRGFTTLSEKIDPESLVALLNHYLDDMCQIVMEKSGTIDKFIGDAIMALWNAPLDDGKHKEHAILTGLAMIKQLDVFNNNHQYDPLKIGIGIHTGEMVVGNIGSRQRFDYTVLGDNVNLSSRIEGLTKKYGLSLLVTADTIRGVEIPNVIFRHIDTVIVKGKSKPIELYQPMDDTSENRSLKKTYEAGYKAYEKGEFEKARKIWAGIAYDPTTQMIVHRIAEVKILKKWNGVWEWTEK